MFLVTQSYTNRPIEGGTHTKRRTDDRVYQVSGDLSRSAVPRDGKHGARQHRAHLDVRRGRHVSVGRLLPAERAP